MKTKPSPIQAGLFALTLAGSFALAIADGLAQLDFGDAPDAPYPTLIANDGARHTATGPILGTFRDTEADGQPNTPATGDDIAGATPDDEDGVFFPDILFPGFADNRVVVTTSGMGPYILNAWMDFNGDGDWADPGEQIFTDTALALGPNFLTFTVPPGLPPARVYSRWRLDTAGGLSYTGAAADGEVEDYCHGSIHGQKWHDRNGDGKRNYTNEEGLNGYEIQLWDATGTTLKAFVGTHDMDHDGTPGINPITERGVYWIHGVPEGYFIVREKADPNSEQTFPAKCGSREYYVRATCEPLGRTPPEQPPVCGPGDHWVDGCPPGQDLFFSIATIVVQGGPFGPDPVTLFGAGDTIVQRGAPQNSGTPPPTHLDQIPIELVELSLVGVTPIEVGGQPFQLHGGAGFGLPPSQGLGTEIPGDPFHVDSFFDVFFEVEVGGGPPLHNNAPLRVGAVIDQVPPIPSEFVKVPGPIPLFDPVDDPTGIEIIELIHKPIYGVDFGNKITNTKRKADKRKKIRRLRKQIRNAKRKDQRAKVRRLNRMLRKCLRELRRL